MPPEDEQLDEAGIPDNWEPAKDPGPLAASENLADLIDENGNVK